MAGNLSSIIPAFFTGPNGEKLTPDQIKGRQAIARSLLGQATDSSPNAGGWASIASKVGLGLISGYQDGKAEAAAGANAKASSANVASMLAGLTGGTALPIGSSSPVGQGAPVANPMVAPAQGVAPAGPTQTVSSLTAQGIDPVAEVVASAPTNGNPSAAGAAKDTGLSFTGKSPYEIASSLIGKGEAPDKATLMEFFKNGGANLDPATTAWCAAFVNSSLGAAGMSGTGKLNARSFLDWGSPVEQPQKGDVAVFSRGDPNGWQGHVGFFDSVNPDGTINVLGGNQGDKVSLSPYPATSLLGYRRPNPQNSVNPSPSPVQAPPQNSGVNPAIVEALSSPYASEQERSVAGLLLNQTMSQQQAAQAKALKQQERQQEIARRVAIAQQNGIDPSFAQDDDLWKGATGQIFAAPSTSTVNNTVIDNRTGKPIYQAPAQNYRQITGPDAAAIGLDPSKAYNVGPDGKIAPIGESGVTVNNNMGGDKFGEEFAKLDAKALDTVATSGQAAQRNIGRINQLGELLKASPSGWEGAVAQRAGEWGIPTKGLDTLQAAQAAINSLVPEQRQPGSGPMSDADLALFKQSLPRIINQPGGNDLIINTMKSIAQYDAEGAKIVQQLRDNKLTRAQAFEALQNRVNPLDSFKVPGAPEENPMPSQQPQSGWKDLGNGVKIRPKGSN